MDKKVDSLQIHSTGDEALSLLTALPGSVGTFVRAYPGSHSEDDSWLDQWYVGHTDKYFNNQITKDDQVLVHEKFPTITENKLVEPMRLKSIEPRYFRGFRVIDLPIDVNANLVVFEGRNSSGKTSLAEALEWLFTGKLSRREGKILGSARELENCITNEFRPDTEKTWVKATFTMNKNERTELITLCRVLESDYGINSDSKCDSKFFKNDVELSYQEERQELDRLFASEPPLLMQHTLRDFVQSAPRERRSYFERLLKLDELTNLISKAVIGDARLKDFPSPTGSKTFKDFTFLEDAIQTDPAKRACNQLFQGKEGDSNEKIKLTLVKVAQHELPELVNKTMDFEQIRNLLQNEQEKAKQKSFSLLEKLRPQRTLEEKANIDHTAEAEEVCKQIRNAWQAYEPSKQAAQQIGKERVVISQALELLVQNKLVQIELSEQTCPLCEYKGIKTLSSKRVSEILGWAPIQQAEKTSKKAFQQQFDLLLDLTKKILKEWDEFLPQIPTDKEWQNALRDASEELKQSSQILRKLKEEENQKYNFSLSYFRKIIKTSLLLPDSLTAVDEQIAQYIQFLKKMNDVTLLIRKYREAFFQIEGAVSRHC